jgi:hypothetical protein
MVNSQKQSTASSEATTNKKKSFLSLCNELLAANIVLANNVKKQAQERIERDNLSKHLFKVSKYGIEIPYRNPDGTPLLFESEKLKRIHDNRRTVAYETPTNYLQFCRYRLSDSLISASGFDGKYYSLSKYETGLSSLPFFTDNCVKAYNDNKQGGTIYFCEGEAKADTMSNFGFEAVGFGGINMFILTPVLIEYLLQRQPYKIVLVYDADYQNKSKNKGFARPVQFFDSAAKFISECKQLLIDNLPIFYICTGEDEANGKGIDDVLLKYNDAAVTAVTALNSLQSNNLLKIEQLTSDSIFRSCTKFFNVLADSRKYADRFFYGNKGEYFKDIVNRHGLSYSDFKGKYIIAPTGIGKSTEIRDFSNHELIVVAVPTNALQKDFEREATKNGIDCYLFNSDKYVKDVKTVSENEEEIINRLKAVKEITQKRFIVVTYRSFEHLVNVLGKATRNYWLIVDEAHNLTSSSDLNYMHGNLSSILSNLKIFKNYTLFTATDLPVFATDLQLEKWIFETPNKIDKNIQFFDKGKNQYETAAQIAAATAKNGNLPLIVLNNKGKVLSKLKRALKPYKTDYQSFNSDTKTETHHKELLNTGIVKTDIMVSTSVIKEGVNIYNTTDNIVLVLISSPGVSPMHAAEIEQFAARFRLAKSVTIIVLVDRENIKFDYTFSFANKANLDYQNAVSKCYNDNQHEEHEREFYGKLDSKFTQHEAVTYNDIKKEWQFCPLLLANSVFRAESEMQRINPMLLIKYLEKFNWRCNDSSGTDVMIHSAEKLEYQKPEAAEITVSESIEQFNEAMFDLENNEPITTSEAKAETSENPFYSLFLKLFEAYECNIDTSTTDAANGALERLRKTNGKIEKVNILKRQLSFRRDLAELMARQKTKATTAAKKAIYNILQAFTSTDGFTAQQVRDIYIKTVLITDFGNNRDLSVLRNDRILKNLTRFFDYTVKVVKVDSNPIKSNKLRDELKEAKTKTEIKKIRKELKEIIKKVKLYYFETVVWI